MSGRGVREKGHRFQRETAELWRSHGHRVEQLQRNLGETLDNLITTPGGVVLAQETRRQERAKISEWLPEIVELAPPGAIPLLTWRRSRWPAWSMLPDDALARLLGGGGDGA